MATNHLTLTATALVKLAAEVGNKEEKTVVMTLANRVNDLELAGGGGGGASTAVIQTMIDDAINDLLDGAPAALDTLKEIADALTAGDTAVTALTAQVNGKANSTDLSAHITDTDIHVTQVEKNHWNAKADASDVVIDDPAVKVLIDAIAAQ